MGTLAMALDLIGSFSFPNGGYGQNVIIFGVDMSSSIHIDNKKKDILILGRGPTQGLESTLTAEKMYSINFTEKNKKLYLSLYFNREIHNFKAKDSKIVANPLCLGNISTDWLINNMKKASFNGYVYHFSSDYDATDNDDIKDIHNYFMKKKI